MVPGTSQVPSSPVWSESLEARWQETPGQAQGWWESGCVPPGKGAGSEWMDGQICFLPKVTVEHLLQAKSLPKDVTLGSVSL